MKLYSNHLSNKSQQQSPCLPRCFTRFAAYDLAVLLLTWTVAQIQAATPYVMANGNYLEGFDDIANWGNGFSSGVGAATWGAVAVNSAGAIPDGQKITVSSATFMTGSSGGVQKGTGSMLLLSTGTSDNTSSTATDLYLDFTGVNAGTLSFDWMEVNNGTSTSDRASSLRIFTSTSGTAWTELTAAAVLNVSNFSAAAGSISSVPLPASFSNSPGARIRFYEYNGTGGHSGSRAKISIDNVAVTATGGTLSRPTTSNPSSQTNLAGATATFSVTAAGGALYYNWRKDGINLNDGGNISGSATPLLTVSNVFAADAGGYSILVTNAAGSVTSAVATLTVIDPAIITQPLSRTNLAGDTASFSVSAAGTASLSHHWRFNGTNLPGAAGTSLSIPNVQSADQGPYSVVVTNGLGASVTSSVATLTLLSTPGTLLARWDFNATNTLSPIAPVPTAGTGEASLVGGTTATFAGGSPSDSTGPPGVADSGWNTAGYPSQGTANKSAGVQFKVSTLGYKNILLTWEERHSNTASKYARLQYSADGVTFIDGPVIVMSATDNSFVFYSADLSAVSGLNNNSNFTFRIVSEFESSAINTANNNYVATVSSYSGGGTIRFDLVNVFANPGVTVSPIPLTGSRLGNKVVLSWTDPAFSLQSAGTVTGLYTNVPGATSPYTNSPTSPSAFFKLRY